MKNYFLLLALASAFTFTSCGDDDKKDDPTPAPVTPATKTQLISDKNWKQTDQTRSANGVTMNTFGNVPACSKDDITKFTKDMKVTFNEGANVCSGSSQTTEGTWSFQNNETALRLTVDAEEMDFNITELSATKLVLSMTEKDTINGTPISMTENYIFTPQQ